MSIVTLIPTLDTRLVERLLHLCCDLDGTAIADAVGVTPGNVSKWRNRKWRGSLHPSTRARIEAILAQPGWKYVPSAPPSPAEERAAAEQASYAAGVLWSIAQDADHLARKAREAHARVMGIKAPQRNPRNTGTTDSAGLAPRPGSEKKQA